MICHYFSVPNKPSLFPALYLYTALKLLFCSTKEKRHVLKLILPCHGIVVHAATTDYYC